MDDSSVTARSNSAIPLSSGNNITNLILVHCSQFDFYPVTFLSNLQGRYWTPREGKDHVTLIYDKKDEGL